MVAEGQVPPDEPAAYALEEFGYSFLTIFWLSGSDDSGTAIPASTEAARLALSSQYFQSQ
jgi:hypothetical protein